MNIPITKQSQGICEKVIKYAIIVITILCLIFVVMSLFRVGLLFHFYDRVFDWVTVRLGFDYYLANFVAISLTAVFSAISPYLCWTLFTGRYKLLSTMSIIAVSGIMCLMAYTLGNDVNIDRKTGEPLKWYCDTPNGRYLSTKPGWDPKFGKKLEPYTPEIIQRESDEAKLRNESEKEVKSSDEGARKMVEEHHGTTETYGTKRPWGDEVKNLEKLVHKPVHKAKSNVSQIESDPRLEELVGLGEKISAGVKMYNDGRYVGAEAVFQQVLERYPNHPVASDYLERTRAARY